MGKSNCEEIRDKPNHIICSICMETNARAETSCTHKFCMKCIRRWVKVHYAFIFREIQHALSAEGKLFI